MRAGGAGHAQNLVSPSSAMLARSARTICFARTTVTVASSDVSIQTHAAAWWRSAGPPGATSRRGRRSCRPPVARGRAPGRRPRRVPPRPRWDSTSSTSVIIANRDPLRGRVRRARALVPAPGAHRTGKRARRDARDAPDAPDAPGSPAPAPSPSPRPAPGFDARPPATRRELAASPSSDLVASPLMPLEFDLRRLSSVAPSRAKDSAIVALSKQLDAMRSRLRGAERTTPAAASDAARPGAAATATATPTTATATAAPTDAAVASTSRRPSTPPQATSARSASPYLTERAKHVAVLRLENEAQRSAPPLQEAERREAAALARVDTERERASREMAAEWATERRRLEVLRFRALARAESKFHERRARIAVGAFRRAVRDARKDRLLERVLLPKFLKMRARAAFSAFARETASRRRVARLDTRATISRRRQAVTANP